NRQTRRASRDRSHDFSPRYCARPSWLVRGVRHDQAHILAVVVSMTHLLHRASHLKRHAIDEQCATYGWVSREQYADKLVPDDADFVALALVVPIQSASLVYRLMANARELRLGAIHIPVAITVLAHQAKVAAVDYWRGITDKPGAANVQIVLVVQVVLARGKLAAAKPRHSSVVDLHEVLAETR